jgi:hypothetical protein
MEMSRPWAEGLSWAQSNRTQTPILARAGMAASGNRNVETNTCSCMASRQFASFQMAADWYGRPEGIGRRRTGGFRGNKKRKRTFSSRESDRKVRFKSSSSGDSSVSRHALHGGVSSLRQLKCGSALQQSNRCLLVAPGRDLSRPRPQQKTPELSLRGQVFTLEV